MLRRTESHNDFNNELEKLCTEIVSEYFIVRGKLAQLRKFDQNSWSRGGNWSFVSYVDPTSTPDFPMLFHKAGQNLDFIA